jgi:hypothetical protein
MLRDKALGREKMVLVPHFLAGAADNQSLARAEDRTGRKRRSLLQIEYTLLRLPLCLPT